MRPSFARRSGIVTVALMMLAALVCGTERLALASDGPTAKATAGRAGCDRIGQRVLTAILRDDIVNANDLTHLYERFACDVKQLRRAFDCVAASQPQPQQAAQATVLIDGCWAEVATSIANGKTKATKKTNKATRPAK